MSPTVYQRRRKLQKKQKQAKKHNTTDKEVGDTAEMPRAPFLARCRAATKRVFGLRQQAVSKRAANNPTQDQETAAAPAAKEEPSENSSATPAGSLSSNESEISWGTSVSHISVERSTSSSDTDPSSVSESIIDQSSTCTSNVTSAPSETLPREMSASLQQSSELPKPSEESTSKATLRRMISVFSLLKRDSAVSIFSKFAKHTKVHKSAATDEFEELDEYDDNGEPTDDVHDRRRFKTIRKIKRKALEDLVLALLYPDEDPVSRSRTCQVVSRTEGSYNHCAFLQIVCEDRVEGELVLKIPAHGTKDTWEDGDAFTMRNEAVLVQHIRFHTDCPVPEVVHFDVTLNNSISAPYVLMKKMPGKCALDFWLGGKVEDMSGDERGAVADSPPEELEQNRRKFLQSLARAMSQLQDLRFEKIGTPVFKDPEDRHPETYGPFWRWHTKLDMHQLTPHSIRYSTGAFFFDGMNLTFGADSFKAARNRGIGLVLDMITSAAPFNRMFRQVPFGDDRDLSEPAKDQFVLRHDDLDLHNILVDDEGNVTGILDWDGIMAAPRCIGYATIPDFLRRDWIPDDWDRAPYATWSLGRYRQIYLDAMMAAGRTADTKFTKKSPMYQAIYAMLWDHEDIADVIAKLMAEIKEFRRVNPEQLFHRLGKGAPQTEKLLKAKITELLAPEDL